MVSEEQKHYIRAGEAIQKARQKAREVTEPGKNIGEIAEDIENLIRREGLEPAFPVNISINEAAAHYTPPKDEEKEISPSDVIKIDIGAHSEGFIADTALTVNPNDRRQELVEAAEKVLSEALEYVEPGVKVGELGRHIESQVPDEYEVIRNLTGHSLGKYTQHAGLSIPNYSNDSDYEFEVGDAFAIEPFLTDGSGKVKNGADGNIYKLERDTSVRGKTERKMMSKIKEFNGLPFTTRWFDDYGARERVAMKKLVQGDIVHSYPVLNEVSGGTVVQAEHTVVLTDEGKKITTKDKK
ncbi:MAG: type II methionyl aminopeptidase [Candidatus Nanosalina sp.]